MTNYHYISGENFECQRNWDPRFSEIFWRPRQRDPAPHYKTFCYWLQLSDSNICAGVDEGQMVVWMKKLLNEEKTLNSIKILSKFPGVAMDLKEPEDTKISG